MEEWIGGCMVVFMMARIGLWADFVEERRGVAARIV